MNLGLPRHEEPRGEHDRRDGDHEGQGRRPEAAEEHPDREEEDEADEGEDHDHVPAGLREALRQRGDVAAQVEAVPVEALGLEGRGDPLQEDRKLLALAIAFVGEDHRDCEIIAAVREEEPPDEGILLQLFLDQRGGLPFGVPVPADADRPPVPPEPHRVQGRLHPGDVVEGEEALLDCVEARRDAGVRGGGAFEADHHHLVGLEGPIEFEVSEVLRLVPEELLAEVRAHRGAGHAPAGEDQEAQPERQDGDAISENEPGEGVHGDEYPSTGRGGQRLWIDRSGCAVHH